MWWPQTKRLVFTFLSPLTFVWCLGWMTSWGPLASVSTPGIGCLEWWSPGIWTVFGWALGSRMDHRLWKGLDNFRVKCDQLKQWKSVRHRIQCHPEYGLILAAVKPTWRKCCLGPLPLSWYFSPLWMSPVWRISLVTRRVSCCCCCCCCCSCCSLGQCSPLSGPGLGPCVGVCLPSVSCVSHQLRS